MNRLVSILLPLAILFLTPCLSHSQTLPQRKTGWNAQWIAAPNENGNVYGVYYFRKTVELANSTAPFIIHVSADNRYKLYVNDSLVSLGPARGDIYYWNYETIDIAPYLKGGRNVIAALVFNEGENRPEAQISFRTAFVLQGYSEKEEIVNTNSSWKCMRDKGRHPVTGFFAASAGELADLNQGITNATAKDLDDSHWSTATQLFGAQPKGMSDGFGWMLVPSPLPQMEMTYERIRSVRKSSGIDVPAAFPSTKTSITIPAYKSVTLLLDQTYLTNAYITLRLSQGKDAGISLRYAESLFEDITKYNGRKGNRDVVEGKDFVGRKDSIISNGQPGQEFTTLYWRSFRYIQLHIETRNEPLVIEDIYGTFTGYPFKMNASIQTPDDEIQKIMTTGWRTARLCAMETYFDCPYYEQLQYIGDTRIQAMVSYYNSGDERLARNAIDLLDHSRLTEGVTQSRWPTRSTQIISTFSLWYIGMLYDYWMYRADASFVQSKLAGERAVLDFFARFQQADGSLKDTPFWTFVDWAGGKNWFVGSPPRGADGSSAMLDLQLLWAFQWSADMEAQLGIPYYAALYRSKAAQLKETIRRKYWDAKKGLFADTEDKTLFSQHTNALAILTGMVPPASLPAMGKRLLTDASLTPCTIYFRYYLNQALVKAGMGNDYLQWLDDWRTNLKMGLTTWAEVSDVDYSRSDCHAWGSSPNIEFFRTVLGIDSDAPGFAKIRIEPRPGTLKQLSGEMPHPKGKITVSYLQQNGKWSFQVSLPAKTSGIFVWNKKQYPLQAGNNRIQL